MLEQPTAMHVARIKSSHTDKQGRRREYESRLLRRTYREDGKVRHETLANLSKLPDHMVDTVEAALRGEILAPAQGTPAVTVTRSLPHGHVAAAMAMASKLGMPRLLGPAGPQRDLALALIISRVTQLETVHARLVARHDARPRPRYRGRGHRRRVRGDGLAGRAAGRHREEPRPQAPRPAGEPVKDGSVRPVELVAGRLALPARGAR